MGQLQLWLFVARISAWAHQIVNGDANLRILKRELGANRGHLTNPGPHTKGQVRKHDYLIFFNNTPHKPKNKKQYFIKQTQKKIKNFNIIWVPALLIIPRFPLPKLIVLEKGF